VLESKSSDLSHFNQSGPNLKLWTPTWLNLMAVRVGRAGEVSENNASEV